MQSQGINQVKEKLATHLMHSLWHAGQLLLKVPFKRMSAKEHIQQVGPHIINLCVSTNPKVTNQPQSNHIYSQTTQGKNSETW